MGFCPPPRFLFSLGGRFTGSRVLTSSFSSSYRFPSESSLVELKSLFPSFWFLLLKIFCIFFSAQARVNMTDATGSTISSFTMSS